MMPYHHRQDLEPIATGLRRALASDDLESFLENTMPSGLEIDHYQLRVARDLLGKICEAICDNDRALWRTLEEVHAQLFRSEAPPEVSRPSSPAAPTKQPEVPGDRASPWSANELRPKGSPASPPPRGGGLEPLASLSGTAAGSSAAGPALPFRRESRSLSVSGAGPLEPHPEMGSTASIAGPGGASETATATVIVAAREVTLEAYASAAAALMAGADEERVLRDLHLPRDAWAALEAAFEEKFSSSPVLRAAYWRCVRSQPHRR